MFRKQAARAAEEAIPEELIANIPVVGATPMGKETTSFAIEEEIILMPPPTATAAAPPGDASPTAGSEAAPIGEMTDAPPASPGAALAAQFRYEMGEALARELDRAEQAMLAAVSDLETRLARAEAELATARAEAERERALREATEARLKAFKELALR